MTARTTRLFLFIVAACAALAAATTTLAQPRQHFVPSPPPTAWRPPVLHVQGAEQPIRLQALKVDVEVSAGVAETRVQMEFFNPNGRVLEGKLQFPLASGQIVSGFALDVDGELRDAVPVEKARAQQVFEDIVRRRVDPGLLQTTLGNNYELRVYPLAPGKTRTVVLRLVEPASTRLSLPLSYAKMVDRFEVSLRYASATESPQIISANPLGMVFERDPRGGFIARRWFDRAVLPDAPLIVRAAAANAIEITTEARGGDTFFTLDLAVSQRSAPRPLPRHVQIVWDASGSAAGRQFDREFALLDAYFKRAGTIAVTLTRFADVAFADERFIVKNGDWSALRRALQATVYDGASQLGAVRHDGVSQEAIWFSDGLANYGAHWRRTFAVPAYMVASSASGDPAALRAVAEASGGRSIDLTVLTLAQATDALLTRGTQLVDVSALGAKEVVVESREATGGRLVIAGILTAGSADLTLRLRGSDGAVTTRKRSNRRRAQRVAARRVAMGASHARVARRRRTRQQGAHPRDRPALRAGDSRNVAAGSRARRRLCPPRDRAAAVIARGVRPAGGDDEEKSRAERCSAAGASRSALRDAGRLVEPHVPEGRAGQGAADRQVAGRRGTKRSAIASPAARRRTERLRRAAADGGSAPLRPDAWPQRRPNANRRTATADRRRRASRSR